MIKKLIDLNDVSFFIEHWLGDEEDYLFNELKTNRSYVDDARPVELLNIIEEVGFLIPNKNLKNEYYTFRISGNL